LPISSIVSSRVSVQPPALLDLQPDHVGAPAELQQRGWFNLYYGCLKGTAYRWLDLRIVMHELGARELPG
jgi:hypothetical protein